MQYGDLSNDAVVCWGLPVGNTLGIGQPEATPRIGAKTCYILRQHMPKTTRQDGFRRFENVFSPTPKVKGCLKFFFSPRANNTRILMGCGETRCTARNPCCATRFSVPVAQSCTSDPNVAPAQQRSSTAAIGFPACRYFPMPQVRRHTHCANSVLPTHPNGACTTSTSGKNDQESTHSNCGG